MPFLEDSLRGALAAVERKFLFRKLGLPFDYASNPDDFPSKAFANAKEARSNLPNPSGLGSGYHATCRNHALLFDAYLLRIESGIESPGDEQILDRLIGGLIRLDTVAPKAFLVGGLSPDGRGFYAATSRENHAAWAFAVNRGLTTAAIAPESQDKFRSISGKWIERLRRDKFRLQTVDGRPEPGGDLSRPEPDNGPFLLAFLLAAARASGEDGDHGEYAEAAEEGSRARLAPFAASGTAGDSGAGLLWRQAALALVAANDPDQGRAGLARMRMRENAIAAMGGVGRWREWDSSLADTPVDLEWRRRPKAPLAESPFGFAPHESWERMARESCLESALTAMYALLLAGDAELARPRAAEMEDCLSALPWDKVMTLSVLAPALGVHARGVELGLWDHKLYESRRERPATEISFAARYLEPDYDERNPRKAGHRGQPPGKRGGGEPREAGTAESARRRKRKRRR